MIVFSPIRTRRITASITEMTADDAIHLCKMRPDLNEAGTTELLSRIVGPDPRPRVGQVTDVRLWTVQERALVVSHYIAHTNEGEPNFPIGEARYADYILDGKDAPEDSLPVGEVEGDKWHLAPLLGIHAESIERLVATGRLEKARHGWWIGAMAAQLRRDGDDFDTTEMSDAELEQHIEDRAKILTAFPESSFMHLLSLYLDAVSRQDHLFRLGFGDDGIVFHPAKKEAGLPPARFPFDSSLSDAAKAVFGNPGKPGG